MAIKTAEQLLRASQIGRCELVRGESDVLAGGPLLPGFELAVRDVFA